MIKRILRISAFALIAFAIYHLLFHSDITVGAFWAKSHFKSLQIIQPVIERYIALWLWDPVMLTLLLAPLWLVSGILGLIILPFGLIKRTSHVQPV
jgi:hypothetical protein